MITARTAKLQGLQRPDTALWAKLDGRMFGALRDELADFTTSVSKASPSAIADLNDGVETLRIAEAIIEASRLGSVVSLVS